MERVRNFGLAIEEFVAFRDALRQSLTPSIDAFLETRSDYSRVGKQVIAGLLIPRERAKAMGVHVEGGWYEYLAGLLSSPTAEKWKGNKLKIITFNYDRSLEFALCGSLRARYRLHDDQAHELLRSIPIVHMYGSLGNFAPASVPDPFAREYSTKATPDNIDIAAKNIKIVHESTDESAEIRRAHDLLRASARVIFLGFGYHPTNVRRLKLEETLKPETLIHGSAMGFTTSEWVTKVVPQFQLPGHQGRTMRSLHEPDTRKGVLAWIRDNVNLFV
jgi:hypothetical protein